MLNPWVGCQKRAPITKGERMMCRDRSGLFAAIILAEKGESRGG